jgi:hypothetical protein
MMTMISFFITGLLLMLAVLLLLPLRVLVDGVADDRNGLGYNLIVDWGFGFVAAKAQPLEVPRLYLMGIPVGRVHLSAKAAQKKKPTNKLQNKRKSSMAWLSWGKNNLKGLSAILIRFMRAIYLQGHLVGHFGLSDPANTACLGLLWNSVKRPSKHMHIDLVCVYEREIIHIEARLQATLIIGYLLIVAVGLLLKKENRTILRSIFQT